MKIKIFLVIVLFQTTTFSGVNKLDPRISRYIYSPDWAKRSLENKLKKENGQSFIDAIITFEGDISIIRDYGARIKCQRGKIAVTSLPVQNLKKIADCPEIIYIESSIPAKPLLDKSRNIIGATKTREQRGLTGRGVFIGIVDSGIDWGHPDFLKPDGTTRIKYLLDLSETGPVYDGTVYTEGEINDALKGLDFIDEIDVSGHGTHVAGIAAGDGSNGSGFGDFAGIAPEADLIVVKATRDEEGRNFLTSDQIVALAFIDSVADLLNKPYVANLSFGGQHGAHDGTYSTEYFIDQLTGRGKPGKVVVVAAGNEGDEDIHAQTEIEANAARITFDIGQYIPNSGSENDMAILDGWYDGSKKIGITLVTPSGQQLGPVLPGDILDKETHEGTIYIWNGFYEDGDGYRNGVNPLNGDREFYIQIYDQNNIQRPAPGVWTLKFSGTGGKIDMWVVNSSMNVAFVDGNVPFGKISVPGTAKNAITVGAFVSKKSWYDVDDHHLTFDSQGEISLGELASFSSIGPVRKGDYVKPEITAPGQILASALSADASPENPFSIFAATDSRYPNALINQDGEHAMAYGTSQAAPHVTGAVALILQEHPEYNAIQIKDMLVKSAETDVFVGQIPNDDWGYGKLNVLRAVQITPGEQAPLLFRLFSPFPNPFMGKTGIDFELPITDNVATINISVYNTIGQKVRTLFSGKKNAGHYSLYWDGRADDGYPVGSGVYFLVMESNQERQVQKLMYLGWEK